ncbi:AAA family ATPase [Natranaerobius thermophilus]|uniref:ATPase associated with various cellular activities AAA_3 n=1 Tax=Natranaerobius thermophilus (strain ATCC BAA-1301 / DSM 18059 / JW/NM-WN-LF) TaxID=457570 RepID=B2A5U1_NATTJ|nr:MoxR family ATPase [Natranaerobius thermophilus]ACB84034.1 ATPase associated with various cellular activities AAA_3 [Natranaerobius thermophilus JW/NM-WN-LF]
MDSSDKLENLIDSLSQAILGKREIIRQLVIGISSNGHILFEDVPGVGKTTLVKGLAKAIGFRFRRVQCTPDLLPADITGVTVYNNKTGEWDFQAGPIFTQILLADEINRTSPKTQSALLEAMEEQQVTVDGTTRYLTEPFFVLATQNPQEYEGTFPLPESQLDRFAMKLTLGYPPKHEEKSLLNKFTYYEPLNYVENIMNPEELLKIQREIEQVYVDDSILEYATELSRESREHQQIELGISPRGTLHLIKSAKATACLAGRNFVLPDDIQEMIYPVYSHRLVINQAALLERLENEEVIQDIINKVRVPGNTGRFR